MKYFYGKSIINELMNSDNIDKPHGTSSNAVIMRKYSDFQFLIVFFFSLRINSRLTKVAICHQKIHVANHPMVLW